MMATPDELLKSRQKRVKKALSGKTMADLKRLESLARGRHRKEFFYSIQQGWLGPSGRILEEIEPLLF